MLILAIETATQSVGVALANEQGVVAHLEVRDVALGLEQSPAMIGYDQLDGALRLDQFA